VKFLAHHHVNQRDKRIIIVPVTTDCAAVSELPGQNAGDMDRRCASRRPHRRGHAPGRLLLSSWGWAGVPAHGMPAIADLGDLKLTYLGFK
jgi:hypothetical protein